MEIWMIWFIIAVICIIIEIFTPSFFFVAFGVGAIFAGLLSFVRINLPLQVVFFIVMSFLFFLWLRRYSNKFFKSGTDETNIYAIVGKTGEVTRTVMQDKKGYVKIMGDEWPALSEKNESYEVGVKVKVVSIHGNTVVVTDDTLKEV